MELFEAIARRHSYRGPFLDRPVSRDTLRNIVEAGLKAPSGRNQQTTEFVIIDDHELLAQVQSMHPSNTAMQQARAYICCVVDKNPEPVYEGISFEVEDCAAATENMFLATAALECATVWVDGWLRFEGRAEKIGRLIGLPEEKTIRVILPIGIPAEEATPPVKKPFEERAWFNRYRTG